MGSEQSHQGTVINNASFSRRRLNSGRLQRGNTTSVVDVEHGQDDSLSKSIDSRPASPPISVCSDSDLPYISYTDRPIGDSPKIRNKEASGSRSARLISAGSTKKSLIKIKQRPESAVHNIVVVKSAVKEPGVEKDTDMLKLQNIPVFLPVMRETLSLSSNRDPEIQRLQSNHLHNICARMQVHYNVCATQVAADQAVIIHEIKEIDQIINKLFAAYIEKQKAYALYAEQFSKIRSITQQLTRCNTLINQNIESLETLNNYLDVDDRLEIFIWKTDK